MPYTFGSRRFRDRLWEGTKWAAAGYICYKLGWPAAEMLRDGIAGIVNYAPLLYIAEFGAKTAALIGGSAALKLQAFDKIELAHYMSNIERRQLYRDETQEEVTFTESMRAPNAAPNLPVQPAIPGVQRAQPAVPVLPQRHRRLI